MRRFKIFPILFLILLIPFLINTAYSSPSSSDESPIIAPVVPEPESISLPMPKPILDLFPDESDSEKIKRLTNESQNLKNIIQITVFEKYLTITDK